MPKDVSLSELEHLIDAGAQLVEVLPQREYEEEHLPGAINIPLKILDRSSAAQLDAHRPVVVYCWNFQ